jgi:cysteine desulfurase
MEVYFDGNATTFMSDETIQYMCKWMNLGNVASNHPIAIKSRAMIEDFKNRIFTDYNLRDHELFFTSGGSESNSFIVSGIVRGYYKKFKSIPHLMISSTEHKSLIMACEQYASEGFAELTYIPILMIRGRHVADMEFIKTNIKSNTCFISVMAANNETGAFYNTDDVCKISSEHNILSYIDAVQVFGKYRGQNLTDADAFGISFHKLDGPTGVGAIIIKKPVLKKFDFPSLICGTQNKGYRGGTENLAGIGGAFHGYIEVMNNINYFRDMDRLKHEMISGLCKIRDCIFLENFKEKVPPENSIVIITPFRSMPNTLLISITGICGKQLQEILANEGFIVSVGSACNTGSEDYSHVLTALNIPEELLGQIIRISFVRENTIKEVRVFLKLFKTLLS